MELDGQRMGDERDWVLVGFFVKCSSSAEKRFIRPAKQDEMGLCRASIAKQELKSQGLAGCYLPVPAPVPVIGQYINFTCAQNPFTLYKHYTIIQHWSYDWDGA